MTPVTRIAAMFTPLLVALFVSASAGCGRHTAAEPTLLEQATSRLSQIEGALQVPGLNDEVRVVRDRWGVPHIYARNADDLFFAQGFVQAQDRLFQMDLWRRATRGHLAEILGDEYVERDRLSRLLRYRGDMDAEWTSYAPDAQRIVTQFVTGINAWIDIARRNLPIEFVLAGYEPATWQPEDVLSRSEAFVMSGNATSEVFRARLAHAVGVQKMAQLLPPDPMTTISAPRGLDLGVVNTRISDALAQIGSGASGFGPALRLTRAPLGTGDGSDEGSNNWVVAGARSGTGRPLLANDPHRALDHPSLRYIVHLNAPEWNVIGATQPWLPGVSFGHNERVAWGHTLFRADAQDLYLEKLNPSNPSQYEYRGRWLDMTVETDRIVVRGRPEPVEVPLQYTRHGAVITTLPDRNMAVVLRWTGAEPGTAAYLGKLGLGRVRSAKELRDNLTRWKMPGENVVYADVDGNIGLQSSALVPIRRNWSGLLPVPGWTGEYEWAGFYDLNDLPNAVNPPAGFIATANHNVLPRGEKRVINYEWSDQARIRRILEVMTSKDTFGLEASKALQHDATAWNASQLVPLLATVSGRDEEVERARRMLLDWDRQLTPDSAASALYVFWEQRLRDRLLRGRVDGELDAAYANRAGQLVVPLLTQPSQTWLGPQPEQRRDEIVLAALSDAVAEGKKRLGSDMPRWRWGRLHTATFRHALAEGADAERLFNIGPFPRAGYGGTPFATGGRDFQQHSGSSYRQIIDLADWDRSVATSAPGQSGQPASRFFDDLAALWSKHEYFPLAFSDEAVKANAAATLTLGPGR